MVIPILVVSGKSKKIERMLNIKMLKEKRFGNLDPHLSAASRVFF
jgi:hypothetical protein